jgi:hypothetical protein
MFKCYHEVSRLSTPSKAKRRTITWFLGKVSSAIRAFFGHRRKKTERLPVELEFFLQMYPRDGQIWRFVIGQLIRRNEQGT